MHANSPAEVPARLEALAALGGLDRQALHSQLAAAVKVVLHVRRATDGARHLAEIGVLHRRDGDLAVEPAWRRDTGWHEAAATLRALVNWPEPHSTKPPAGRTPPAGSTPSAGSTPPVSRGLPTGTPLPSSRASPPGVALRSGWAPLPDAAEAAVGAGSEAGAP